MATKQISKNKKIKSICEVGTGSGCIILSILAAANRPLEAIATDICKDALSVAQINYFRLKNCIFPRSSVTFHLGDRLQNINKKFDLIVTNPPYIKLETDMHTVHRQVKSYEPHKALFLEDGEYTRWFEVFFKQVGTCLSDQGMFIMEGHEDHLPALEVQAQKMFSSTKLENDLTGRPRFLMATKKD